MVVIYKWDVNSFINRLLEATFSKVAWVCCISVGWRCVFHGWFQIQRNVYSKDLTGYGTQYVLAMISKVQYIIQIHPYLFHTNNEANQMQTISVLIAGVWIGKNQTDEITFTKLYKMTYKIMFPNLWEVLRHPFEVLQLYKRNL